tara:strand:- start:587 stop:778 length:192 start_codon:yes stop_codon:yes gene_type:complete
MAKRKKFNGKMFSLLGMPVVKKDLKPKMEQYKKQGYKYFRTTKSTQEVGRYYIYTEIWGRKTK